MTIKTEPLDTSIGRRIAAARTASGCTVCEAAAHLKLSEADYCAREEGRQRFRSRDLAALAGLFAIEVRSLFEDESEASDRAAPARGFALADWIEASRHREGLSALLQSDQRIYVDPLKIKAA